ncbi:titin [Trichonephila clavipes]|nr:titin [Trichonephila clavipes]
MDRVLWMLILSFFVASTSGVNSPQIKPFSFSGELREGLRTNVMCSVIDGDPPFDFQWFKDNRPLSQEKGQYSVQPFDEFTAILTIKNLDSSSNGNYSCRVTNAAGSDQKSGVLSMKGGLKYGGIILISLADMEENHIPPSLVCTPFHCRKVRREMGSTENGYHGAAIYA